MTDQNSNYQTLLQQYTADVERAKAKFMAEWHKKTEADSELKRQNNVINAIETELEELKKQAQRLIEGGTMPTAEMYAEIKQKERDLEDKKGYLALSKDAIQIQQLERSIHLSHAKRGVINAVDKLHKFYFNHLLSEFLETHKNEFHRLIAIKNRSVYFQQENYFLNLTYQEYTPPAQRIKELLFNAMESVLNFENKEYHDEFLDNHCLDKELFSFEEVRVTAERKVFSEIEQLKRNQLERVK